MKLKKSICIMLCVAIFMMFYSAAIAEDPKGPVPKKSRWTFPLPTDDKVDYGFWDMKNTIKSRRAIKYLDFNRDIYFDDTQLKDSAVYKIKAAESNIRIQVDKNFVVAVFDSELEVVEHNIKSTRNMGDTLDFIYFNSKDKKESNEGISHEESMVPKGHGNYIEVVFNDEIEMSLTKEKDYYICIESLKGVYSCLDTIPKYPKIKVIGKRSANCDNSDDEDYNENIKEAESISQESGSFTRKSDYKGDKDYYLLNIKGEYSFKINSNSNIRLFDENGEDIAYRNINGSKVYNIYDKNKIYMEIINNFIGDYTVTIDRYYNGEIVKYVYDRTNTRLMQIEIGRVLINFDYDGSGNLLSKSIVRR